MDKSTPIRKKPFFWIFIALFLNAAFVFAFQCVAAVDFSQEPLLLNSPLYWISGYLGSYVLLCILVIEVIALFLVSAYFIASTRWGLAIIAVLLIAIPIAAGLIYSPKISESYSEKSDERVLALRKNFSDDMFVFSDEVEPYKEVILLNFKDVAGYPLIKKGQMPLQRSIYIYEDEHGNTFDIFFSRGKPEIRVYNRALNIEKLEKLLNHEGASAPLQPLTQ